MKGVGAFAHLSKWYCFCIDSWCKLCGIRICGFAVAPHLEEGWVYETRPRPEPDENAEFIQAKNLGDFKLEGMALRNDFYIKRLSPRC